MRPKYDDDFNIIGAESEADPCPLLNGKPCYYDGSSLAAIDVFNILREKGSDAV